MQNLLGTSTGRLWRSSLLCPPAEHCHYENSQTAKSENGGLGNHRAIRANEKVTRTGLPTAGSQRLIDADGPADIVEIERAGSGSIPERAGRIRAGIEEVWILVIGR